MRYFEHLIEFKMVLNSLLMKKEERRSDWAIRSNLEADRVVRFSFLGRWFVWESDKTEKNDSRTWKKDIKRKRSSPLMPVEASDAAAATFGRREKCRLEIWPTRVSKSFLDVLIFALSWTLKVLVLCRLTRNQLHHLSAKMTKGLQLLMHGYF